MTSYAVVIDRADDGGYGAWCPELPGAVAVADMEEDLLAETAPVFPSSKSAEPRRWPAANS
jgi:predicted RNase H-like HicB family nuclease